VVLCAADPGAACSLAWQVAGDTVPTDRAVVRCQDGDPACDADGVADGGCTFTVALCAAGCAVEGLRVRGPNATALAAPVSDGCGAVRPLRVALRGRRRRRIVLRAVDRPGRARVALTCMASPAARAGIAAVVTTDFETGALATVGVSRHAVGHPSTPIHSDAVVRTAGGLVYVVNRLGGDNLEVLDPARGFASILQCSTGVGSNPHDVALVDAHKAYVTRFNRPELWIVDPGAPPSCAGFFRGAIDLGPYAAANGIPDMDQMALVGDRLFVSLEELDRNRQFAPAGKSRLVVIDVTTDQVVGTVVLSGTNAFSASPEIRRDPTTGALLLAEVGNIYKTGDGGIERVDPTTLTASGFFVTERELGGNITDFLIVSGTKGYALLLDDSLRNELVAFDPSRGVVTRRMFASAQYLSAIELAPDGTLWLADRTLGASGIRIFDTTTDRQRTRTPIPTGLPPFAMAFLP
jgi:DNA-binding beta-propeller fold protein YncE